MSRPTRVTPDTTLEAGPSDTSQSKRSRLGLAGVVWAYLPVVLIARRSFGTVFEAQVLRNWSTIFVSVTLQALPFLVLGVVVSAAISALVPAHWLARAVPKPTALAVPTAGLAGALLPGCECSSVPVAGRLVSRGVPVAAGLTFLLAAPAINPIVMVSTAVAFPGQPEMVIGRFVASFLTAVVVGFVWSVVAKPDWIEDRLVAHRHGSSFENFVSTATSDFLQAGGFLVAGAGMVASLQTLVPTSVLDRIGGSGLVAILTMAALAVLLSVCSEADAFVAAGLTQFSLTARTGVPRRRSDGRPQARRVADRLLRSAVRHPLRPDDAGHGHRHRDGRRERAHVRRADAGALVIVTGLFALWVGLTDVALLYVRPGARLWLTIAGGTLVVLGFILLVLNWRHRGDRDEPDEAHHAGRIGLLLAVPLAVAIAVGSNPLGSYAAGRQNGERTLPAGHFDLDAYLNAGSFGGQAPALRVMDFIRAAHDPEERDVLADTRVTLRGFVTEDDSSDHPHAFLLTRFTIGCCAADAIAMFVRVELEDHHIPATDSWVDVEGSLVLEPLPDDGSIPEPPTLRATELRAVDQPREVYEYPP